MADFVLQDNQNVDVAIAFVDAAGNPASVDPGSVTAVLADGTEFTVTLDAAQTSVNVKALGPVTTGDVLTVSCTVGGTAIATPGTIAFDVISGPATAVTLTPGTPATN